MDDRMVFGFDTWDGWGVFLGLPGWEHHEVKARAAVIDGQARVIAVQVEPLDGHVEALTVNRLRSLPLGDLARMIVKVQGVETGEQAREALGGESLPDVPERGKRGPRSRVSVQQVADVWQTAHDQGAAPRAAVCADLHMSARTADRYIAKARERGLLREGDVLLSAPKTPRRQSSGPAKKKEND